VFHSLLPWRHERTVVIDDGSDAFPLPDGRVACVRYDNLEGLGCFWSAVLPHSYRDLSGKGERRELKFAIGFAIVVLACAAGRLRPVANANRSVGRVIETYGADKGLVQTMARLADYVAAFREARGKLGKTG